MAAAQPASVKASSKAQATRPNASPRLTQNSPKLGASWEFHFLGQEISEKLWQWGAFDKESAIGHKRP
jgi:hypothetical protein